MLRYTVEQRVTILSTQRNPESTGKQCA